MWASPPEARSPGGSEPAADDLDRAVQRHRGGGHRRGGLADSPDKDEELLDRDIPGDHAPVFRLREDAADGGLDPAGGFLHGRRELAALADERDQGELRRARLDEDDDELANRPAR